MGQHTPYWKTSLAALALLATTVAGADQAQRYTNAKGFQAVNTEKLEGDGYYSAARFPAQGASAFHPDADLPAPVRALLLMEAHEGALPHARYLVNYQPTSEASAPDEVHDYVEITRFNLGPAVHADLLGSVPAEHLASVREFGVGPHVRWRLAMSPMRGMTAGLDAVSRRPVSAQEAGEMKCLGSPCAGLQSAEGPKGPWKSQKLSPLPPSFARVTEHGPAAASVVEQLLTLLGEDAQRAASFSPDAQRLVLVVSVNAGGQEQATTGLARNALVFDDRIGTHWVRMHQMAGMAPTAQSMSQRRK